MTLELINPAGLPVPQSYSQVASATGTRTVFVAGQVADGPEGGPVGVGDLAAQADQAFASLGRALAAARVRPDQVARLGIYVVGYRPEFLPAISRARVSVFGDHLPADTLIGVAALAQPHYLIEVDAVAVVD